MGLFVAFAQPVIERLGPTYAIVTEGYPKATYGREILSATLKHIHWCNYYGPTYLKKYGEDVFLNAPGWHSERLGEGIWYQTAERFDDSKDELLKQQILEHFKPIDVRKVV